MKNNHISSLWKGCRRLLEIPETHNAITHSVWVRHRDFIHASGNPTTIINGFNIRSVHPSDEGMPASRCLTLKTQENLKIDTFIYLNEHIGQMSDK